MRHRRQNRHQVRMRLKLRKKELLVVLDRPEVPLNTNNS
ncbi:hypothetical protein WCLP8_1160002 [uncultured Gammaproteobacteria bacterium]